LFVERGNSMTVIRQAWASSAEIAPGLIPLLVHNQDFMGICAEISLLARGI
jgi:hypothetical protein